MNQESSLQYVITRETLAIKPCQLPAGVGEAEGMSERPCGAQINAQHKTRRRVAVSLRRLSPAGGVVGRGAGR